MMDKRKCLLIKGWEMIVRRKLKWVEAEINRHGSLGLAQTFFQFFFKIASSKFAVFRHQQLLFILAFSLCYFFVLIFFLYEFVWLFVLLWNNAQLIEWKNSLYSRIFRSWFSSLFLSLSLKIFLYFFCNSHNFFNEF